MSDTPPPTVLIDASTVEVWSTQRQLLCSMLGWRCGADRICVLFRGGDGRDVVIGIANVPDTPHAVHDGFVRYYADSARVYIWAHTFVHACCFAAWLCDGMPMDAECILPVPSRRDVPTWLKSNAYPRKHVSVRRWNAEYAQCRQRSRGDPLYVSPIRALRYYFSGAVLPRVTDPLRPFPFVFSHLFPHGTATQVIVVSHTTFHHMGRTPYKPDFIVELVYSTGPLLPFRGPRFRYVQAWLDRQRGIPIFRIYVREALAANIGNAQIESAVRACIQSAADGAAFVRPDPTLVQWCERRPPVHR